MVVFRTHGPIQTCPNLANPSTLPSNPSEQLTCAKHVFPD